MFVLSLLFELSRALLIAQHIIIRSSVAIFVINQVDVTAV